MATDYFLVGTATQTAAIYIDSYKSYVTLCEILTIITRGQSNLTKSDSRGDYFLVGTATQTAAIYIDRYKSYVTLCEILTIITRGQSNLTKSDSRGAHSPVRGHPRGV